MQPLLRDAIFLLLIDDIILLSAHLPFKDAINFMQQMFKDAITLRNQCLEML